MQESKGLTYMREEFLREGFLDTIIPLREWTTPTGEIGVYRSETYGYLYLLVLTTTGEQDDQYLHPYEKQMPPHTALSDAAVIARVAGATERPQ